MNGHQAHLPEQFGMKPGAEHFPLMVLPSVSNQCNAKCVHCWFNAKPALRQRDGVRFMAPDLLRKIIDEIAQHTDPKPLMRITGTGEPFLMPGLCEAMVYAAQERGVRTAVITNGSLVTEEIGRRLVEAGVEAIEISVDAGDAESYERIRRNLKFATLVEQIHALIRWRDQSGSATRVLVSIVENPEAGDPVAAQAFWQSRVDHVILRKYLTYGQISESLYSPETYLPMDQRVPCPYPFERLVILASGETTFCNFDVADGFYMGNVNQQTIAEIWQGERFRQWRELVLQRRFEDVPLCAKCQDWKYKSWNFNFFKVLDDTRKPE